MDKAYRPSLSSYWKKRYNPLGKFTQAGVDVVVGRGNAVFVAMAGVASVVIVGLAGSGCVELGEVAVTEVP